MPESPQSPRVLPRIAFILITGGLLAGGALWFADWWQHRENKRVSEHHNRIFHQASDAIDQHEAKRQAERERMRAASETAAFDLSNLAVDRSALRDSGRSQNTIPALVNPLIQPWDDIDFLDPDDRVLGVTINGESRAYPINMLNLHGVVNDELGGEAIAVIFCPLCDSASVVRRAVGDEVLKLGVSGQLLNSNMVLYDHAHDALWSQIGMQAISGPHTGARPVHINSWALTTLADWTRIHPDARLAAPPRDSDLNYAMNPYRAYLASDQLMDRFAPETIDDRLPAKARIIGIRIGASAVACPVAAIHTADGELDVPIGDQVVSLSATGNSGVQVVSAPADAQVMHTFWFAWAAFHPDTTIIGQ